MKTVLNRITRNNLIAGLLASAASLVFRSERVTTGMVAGAALMAADLWVIRFVAVRLLGPGRSGILLPLATLFFKLGLFLVTAWILVMFLPMNLYAFGVGVAVVVFTTTGTAAIYRETFARS